MRGDRELVNINIICVGKLKEKYWTDAAAEYVKRLSRYCRIRIVELKEERLPDNASASEEEYVKTAEGRSILKGLSDEVRKRADFKLSFSSMTFPHQMMRVILLEQIYRAFKISRREPYHK